MTRASSIYAGAGIYAVMRHADAAGIDYGEASASANAALVVLRRDSRHSRSSVADRSAVDPFPRAAAMLSQ
ncbi:hypothetical protein BD311DRAFT_240981, partial [Dichomitus squalens]